MNPNNFGEKPIPQLEENTLDNLIIDDAQPSRRDRSKLFFTILGLTIVLLIVIILFTQTTIEVAENNQTTKSLTFEQNLTDEKSIDTRLKPRETEEETFDDIDEIETSRLKERKPPVLESETEEEIQGDTATLNTEKEETVAKEETATKEKKPLEKAEESLTPSATPTIQPIQETPKPKPTPKPTPTIKPKPPVIEKEIPKKPTPHSEKTVQTVPQKVVERPSGRPLNLLTRPEEANFEKTNANTQSKPQSSPKATPNGGYYIQVGAFSHAPSKSFLNKIQSQGFGYTVRTLNNTHKVLVGPFSDVNRAKTGLSKVKSTINSGAFIVK